MSSNEPPSLIRIARASGVEAAVEPLNLGARVRQLRKDRGWTLEQAAQQAGLARSTLSKIENGQMSPTYEALKKLAEGLAISVPQLFTPPSGAQVNGLQVYNYDGRVMSQLSVGEEHVDPKTGRATLLAGGVYEDGVLMCRL